MARRRVPSEELARAYDLQVNSCAVDVTHVMQGVVTTSLTLSEESYAVEAISKQTCTRENLHKTNKVRRVDECRDRVCVPKVVGR